MTKQNQMQYEDINYFRQYISGIEENKYAELESYFKILNRCSLLTNECLYIYDYSQDKIPFVSYNPIHSQGIDPGLFRNAEKMTFKSENISKEDLDMMIEVAQAWIEFLYQEEESKRKKYILKFDYELNKRMVSLSITPFLLNDKGELWMTLCRVKLSGHSHSGHIIIKEQNGEHYWEYAGNRKWIEKSFPKLKDIERTILRLCIQGKKEQEICDHIHKSKDSLKSIKRKMFESMEVTNITQAVSKAITYGLI